MIWGPFQPSSCGLVKFLPCALAHRAAPCCAKHSTCPQVLILVPLGSVRLHSLYFSVKSKHPWVTIYSTRYIIYTVLSQPLWPVPGFTQLPAAVVSSPAWAEGMQHRPGTALAPPSARAFCLLRGSATHLCFLKMTWVPLTRLPQHNTTHKKTKQKPLNIPVYICCLWSSS